MNNAVYLLTGVSWGVGHAVLTTSRGSPRVAYGLATGVAAWAASYALLVPAGLYRPMRE